MKKENAHVITGILLFIQPSEVESEKVILRNIILAFFYLIENRGRLITEQILLLHGL